MEKIKSLDIKKMLIQRALKDSAFKKRLLDNPRKIIEEEFLVKLPNEINIKVVEETDSEKYLVLPSKETGELSEQELQAIAGGYSLDEFWSDIKSTIKPHNYKSGDFGTPSPEE